MRIICSVALSAAAALLAVGCSSSSPKRILKEMNLREKVSQIVIAEIYGGTEKGDGSKMKELVEGGLGGIIWMDAPVADLVEQTNALAQFAKIPLLTTVDAEWGLSMRCPEYVPFPRQGVLGEKEGMEEDIYRMGRAIGKDLRELKVMANFAPVVDINTNPSVNILGTRSFGSDRDRVIEYASAYMRGLQDEGILACAKHFPGHGEAAVDSHKSLPVLTLSKKRLKSVELAPYKRLIKEKVGMIMIGHLSVPALDKSGTPASISRPIVTGLLRKKMGYKGCIITDALQMDGLTIGRDKNEVVLEAFQAGADILLMPSDPIGAIDLLVQKVESGEVAISKLDQRVLRMLRLKKRLGLLDKKYSPIVENVEEIVQKARERDSALAEEIDKKLK